MHTEADLAKSIANLPGAQFARFTYRSKGDGKLANVTVILGASTETLYRKDILALSALLPTLSEPLDVLAANEILASREKSLEVGIGNNPAYTCAGAFIFPPSLPGVKVCITDASLHVCGLLQAETVLEPGTPKNVKSSAKTIAKRKIEKTLPSARFRQYRLDNVLSAKVAGEVLEIQTGM